MTVVIGAAENHDHIRIFFHQMVAGVEITIELRDFIRDFSPGDPGAADTIVAADSAGHSGKTGNIAGFVAAGAHTFSDTVTDEIDL